MGESWASHGRVMGEAWAKHRHLCGAIHEDGSVVDVVSQDTLPSPLPIGCLTKYYYSYCTTSDVYGTPVSTSDYRIFQYGSVKTQ